VKFKTDENITFSRRAVRFARHRADQVLQGRGYHVIATPERDWDGWHERVANAERLRLLRDYDVDLVLDVGANTGLYGSALRSSGYKGPIISFEPLKDCLKQLNAMAQSAGDWEVFPVAVGAEEAELDINVAGNSVSSSLLPMLDSHKQAAPESQYVKTERVTVLPLDVAIKRSRFNDRRRLCTKIDTQGYEWPAIEGATEVLSRSSVLELELSFVPLYEGQLLFHDLVPALEKRGFVLSSMQKVFSDPATGKLLQVDGLFVRVDAPRRSTAST
jgi:FkbM family methyltransferase